jgi:iron(II)-dependent oxidoreductase
VVEPGNSALARELREARRHTLGLLEGLDDDQLAVPRLPTLNPFLWGAGHIAWFQELWTLRHLHGERPWRADGDRLYDSAKVAHELRWDLPLPSRAETLRSMAEVLERVLERLAGAELTREQRYFHLLAIFHEDMHAEAWVCALQTLALPAPARAREEPPAAGPLAGDVELPGGAFLLGSPRGADFVFDNEKWEHQVELAPFRIARAPVTQAEFAAFVEEKGYARRELWSEAGWSWRQRERAEAPSTWRRDGREWLRRAFDRWLPLEPHRPVLHVSWHEADAWCRWAGRRLPSEAEWERAATLETDPGRQSKRAHPWGQAEPAPDRAWLDLRGSGCADVAALERGDSAAGCRQMIGNVWEWVADDFLPYPGFSPDPYLEYSQPWFGTHKVLRGGSFATRSRLIRSSYRNFFTPERRDILAGFRTAELAT